MKNDFNLCPECGSKNIQNKNNRKWICPDCGFDLYCNVASAVGVVISDKDNNVLMEVRAKEPRKGFLAFPGGFVDPDERAEDAVKRECLEEIGAEVENVKFLCTFPNTYEYKSIEYKTCDMFFSAELNFENDTIQSVIEKLHAQESEVQGFASVHVGSEKEIMEIPLAFESARNTLLCWLKNRNSK